MSQPLSTVDPPAGDRPEDSRRQFIRGSSLLLAGALPAAGLPATGLPAAATVDSLGQPPTIAPAAWGLIKVGLVGCGSRGMTVVNNLLAASRSHGCVKLTAVADAFPDSLQRVLRGLKGKYPQQVSVDSASRCLGLDGYRQLLDRDVDLVLLATPPAFRPQHFEAAVAAGKHIYAEKPIAIDVLGVERFQAANQLALEQRLVVGVGLPRRFQPQYQATVAQLRSGAIGQIVSARAIQSVRQPRTNPSGKSRSELEVQLRNWTHHAWASGGPWVEPHVQNLDVINWVLGDHPLEAEPLEAKPQRSDSKQHDGPSPIEFRYASGVSVLSQCLLIDDNGPARLSLTVQGSRGHCDLAAGKIFDSNGRLAWRATSAGGEDGLMQSLLAAIGEGAQFNQAGDAVEATLTAILGRTASSHGQRVGWDELHSS
ncbi:MAG: Gfo/Idh/MocA family oxidoreductase [Planctomycetales bacterium]|nr:Gfo/Idh/MocA family oxidoreductase [Planctomycetales bacterium]